MENELKVGCIRYTSWCFPVVVELARAFAAIGYSTRNPSHEEFSTNTTTASIKQQQAISFWIQSSGRFHAKIHQINCISCIKIHVDATFAQTLTRKQLGNAEILKP